MPEVMFTIAQADHSDYPGPEGTGVHTYPDQFGNQWEIHFSPGKFQVYRRWLKEEPEDPELISVPMTEGDDV